MDTYNVKWNTFSEHMGDILFQMLNSKYLTDVTLVCDDKEKLYAHKIVLAACSNAFKQFITDLPEGTSSVIYLKGIQFKEMNSILEFMYSGKTEIKNNGIEKLYDVARNLEVIEICKFIETINNHETKDDSVYAMEDFDDLEEILQESFDELENQISDPKDDWIRRLLS